MNDFTYVLGSDNQLEFKKYISSNCTFLKNVRKKSTWYENQLFVMDELSFFNAFEIFILEHSTHLDANIGNWQLVMDY